MKTSYRYLRLDVIQREAGIYDLAKYKMVCVVIPSLVREGSTLLGDHKGSILLNRAETSQEANLERF